MFGKVAAMLTVDKNRNSNELVYITIRVSTEHTKFITLARQLSSVLKIGRRGKMLKGMHT